MAIPAISSANRRKRQKGYILMVGAMALAGFIGFMGLAVDVGNLERLRLQAQTAADAAAANAAMEKANGGDSNKLLTSGQLAASLNGFTAATGGPVVTINNPPSSGYYSANSSYVEAIVSAPEPTYFMKFFNMNSVAVAARAVAKAGGSGGGACIYALDPSGSYAFNMTGSGTRTICGVKVNSNHASSAMHTSGSNCIISTFIGVVGGTALAGSCPPTPAPTAISPFTDPLAQVAAPTVPSGCDYTSWYKSGGVWALSPGVYCGGIKASSNATLTFSPGLYILNGGGLDITGSGSITGTGVTFYLTGDATYAYKGVQISGTTNVAFTAPTTGAQAAMLFFSDRSILAGTGTGRASAITNSGTQTYTGAFYFPNTDLTWTGSASVSSGPYTIIVAKTVTMTGSTNLGSDYSSLPGGSPLNDGAKGITYGE